MAADAQEFAGSPMQRGGGGEDSECWQGAVGGVAAHQQAALTPAARAVAVAWATILPAPLPEPVRPARSRIPAITGAAVSTKWARSSSAPAPARG